jgi:HSP20 family molecular chaperone IbpA
MSNQRTVSLWARPALSADRWVRDFFGPATVNDWFKPLPAALQPASEIVKDGDDAIVRLELPGIDITKDVNVDIEDGRLVIHGERRDEHATEDPADDPRVLREVRYGSFRRSFALPEHITGDAVSASYGAGVLRVRVAGAYKKPEAPGAQRIEIVTD